MVPCTILEALEQRLQALGAVGIYGTSRLFSAVTDVIVCERLLLLILDSSA